MSTILEQEKTLGVTHDQPDRVGSWDAGKTRYGKTLEIVPATRGLFTINMKGGGKFPKQLAGKFSSAEQAQQAVDSYLIAHSYTTRETVLKKKEKKSNGKTSG